MQQTVYNLFCEFTTDVLLELKSDIIFVYVLTYGKNSIVHETPVILVFILYSNKLSEFDITF